MSGLLYKTIESGRVFSVRLDGKQVGTITIHPNGWRYHTIHSMHKGEVFDTLAECKASLEDD